MDEPGKTFYEFGPFRMDPKTRVLFRNGDPVALTPKAFQTLLILVENRHRVMPKEELIEVLWPDSFVEEANLAVNISALRKALGESPNDHRYVVTVPGLGYRFVADVQGPEAPVEHVQVPDRDNSAAEATPVVDSHHESTTSSRRSVWIPALIVVGIVVVAVGVYFARKSLSNQVEIRSIAVLPFKPLVPERRDESLEMGMADTLIFRLSNIRGLEVRPIGAVRKYTNLDQDPLAAGIEQQVDAVVDGNIQIDGDRVRVTARLVRVADGSVIWTDKGEQRGAGLFELQDSITEDLVQSLALKLTDAERLRLTKRYTENAEAYRLYLLGRHQLNKRTTDGFKKSIEYFNQSLEADPTNALAFSGLADAYSSLGGWQILPANETFPKAREAAQKALLLDDSLAEARTSMALVMNFSSDWRDAEAEFKRAIELNPNYDAAHRWYGFHLRGLGRLDEAKAETMRALELDPLSLQHNAQLGRIFYAMRDYDRAVEQYQKTLEIDPNFVIAHLELGWTFEQKRMYQEALAEYEKVIALQGQPEAGERVGGRGGVEARIGRVQALSGNREEAQRILSELDAAPSRGPISSYNEALIYDGLGDKEEAISRLEKMFEVTSQRFGLKTDPTWDNLRSHPRFQQLLERIESKQVP